MALTEQAIELNALTNSLEPKVYVVQADSGRSIRCTIADWTMPDDATATVYAKKPSGKIVYNACTVDTDTNSVLVELTNQMIAEAGTTAAMVEINSNDECVTAFQFGLIVRSKISGGTVSTSESTELQALINELSASVQAALKESNTATEKAAAAATEATEAAQNAATAAEEAKNAANEAMSLVGAPLTAATADEMEDTTHVYVYTGSEDGYTYGAWYYYDGTAWQYGGMYEASVLSIDATLSVSGAPADAAATGAAIKTAQSTADSAASTASSALTAANAAKTTAESAQTLADELGNEVDELKEKVESGLGGSGTLADINQLGLTEDEGYLYVIDTTTGEHGTEGWEIQTTGGSGTGTSTKLKITSGTSATIAQGSDYTITWTFSSTDSDGDETGDGYGVLTLNDEIIYQASITQGDGSYTLTSDTLVLGSNSISLAVTNADGNTLTRTATITVVALSISSTFDDSTVYSGEVTFRYTPVGSGLAKVIHFVLDGVEIDTATVTTTGRQQTYTIPEQSHGAHTFLVYATATISGATATSNELYFEIAWVDDSSTDVIITSSYQGGTVTEGETISVPYLVYDPSATTATVTRSIIDSTGSVYYTATATVERTTQYWTINDYPSGNITLRLTCGNTTKDISITVEAADINLTPATSAQVYYLSAISRSNSDTDKENADYGNVKATLSNFNYASDGWMGTTLRFQGDDLLEIEYKPFEPDIRSTGFTAEFEFTTIAVRDMDAVIISCMNGGRGFEITAQSASLYSLQNSKTIYFQEGTRIRVTFSVESNTENRIVRLCVNGVPYGEFQYPTGDNFQQSSPVNITIGNEDCSFDLHTVRIHTAGLSDQERVSNWIYDRDTYAEKAELSEMNDIYDDYGALSRTKVMKLLPCMMITGTESTGKKDYQDAQIVFSHSSDATKDFTDLLAIWYVQGTSSTGFPVKNWRINLSEAYKLYDNLVDQILYCLKANYMDSSGACNTGAANLFDYIYRQMGWLTPPMEQDENIRMCIAGYPIILWHRDTEADEYEFAGIYTFNLDKGSGTEALYGALEEEWPGVQWWEFGNNTSAHCLFQDATIDDDISTDIEVRYGAEDWTIMSNAIQFVIDCNGDPDAFVANAESYFNIDFLIGYYILSEVFGCSDSRAKNMMMACWPSVSNQLYPAWYDIDTMAGRNNEGLPQFPYDMEAHSQYGTAMAFNGEQSQLWYLTEEGYADKIMSDYQTMRSKGYLSIDTITEYMVTPFAGSIPASLYVEDGVFKYELPTLNEGEDQLPIAQGDWSSYFLRWMTYSLAYRDSKYQATQFTSDRISLRIYSPTTASITDETVKAKVEASLAAVPPDQNFEVATAIHYFPAALYGANGYLIQVECQEGETVTIIAPTLSNFNDLESYLEGAAWYTDIGDLSPKYPGSINISSAKLLRYARFGNRNSAYYNTNLTSAVFGNNSMLELVILSNCPNLSGSIDVSNCPALEEFYAEGTAVTSVSFSNGGRLKIAYLPSTVTNFELKNQPMVDEIVFESHDSLVQLVVENCQTLDTYTLANAASNLEYVRLTNVDWTLNDSSLLIRLAKLKGLDANGATTTIAVVTGKAYVDSISPSSLATITEAFPELELTYGTTEAEYTVTFYDYDSVTVLFTETIERAQDGWDPVASGDIATPTRESTVDTVYTFAGWSGSYSYVTGNTSCVAVYSSATRTYTVNYYNGAVKVQSTTVEVYGSCTYTGSDLQKTGYIWEGWDNTASYVVDDMDIYAVFITPSLPSEIRDMSQYDYVYSDIDGETSAYTFGELYAIANAGMGEQYFSETDKIHLDLSESTTTNDTDIELNCHSFGHYELADGSGDMSGADFYMTGVLVSSRAMNSSATNAGGWDESAMRDWLNNTFYPSLPPKWRQIIELSYTLANAGNQSTTITKSADYLRIMSTSEVGFDTTATPYKNEVSENANEIAFSQYTSNSARIKCQYNGEGSAQAYWLRSADSGSTSSFRAVSNYGSSYSNSATNGSYVCLGFSIGRKS